MSEITERTKVVNTADTLRQASILKNALKIALGTILSRVLGLLRESMLAYWFDRSTTDALSAAFRVPNFFRRLLNEGAFSLSLVPVVANNQKRSPQKLQKLLSSMFLITLLFSAILTWAAIYNVESILYFILDTNYTQQVDQFTLTCRLAQIMFGFIFFIINCAFALAILNAIDDFLWPALAPTLLNLSMLAATVWPLFMKESKDTQAVVVAWGVCIGGLLQMSFLFTRLYVKKVFPILQFHLLNWIEVGQEIMNVMKGIIPGFLSVGFLQILVLINLKFVSMLGEGTISSFQYVDRLIELPLSVVAVALGGSLLSSLARSHQSSEISYLRSKLYLGLKFNFFLMITSAFLLSHLSYPIVKLLFERGNFQQGDVERTSFILSYYAWIIISISGSRIIASTYFSIGKIKWPLFAVVISLFMHVLILNLLTEISLTEVLNASLISSGFYFIILLYGLRVYMNSNFIFNLVRDCFFYILFGYIIATIGNQVLTYLSSIVGLFGSFIVCALFVAFCILMSLRFVFFDLYKGLKEKILRSDNV